MKRYAALLLLTHTHTHKYTHSHTHVDKRDRRQRDEGGLGKDIDGGRVKPLKVVVILHWYEFLPWYHDDSRRQILYSAAISFRFEAPISNLIHFFEVINFNGLSLSLPSFLYRTSHTHKHTEKLYIKFEKFWIWKANFTSFLPTTEST